MRGLRERLGRHTRLVVVLLGVIGIASVIGLLAVAGIVDGGGGVGPAAAADTGNAPAGTQTQFVFLAGQHTNFCSLQQGAVLGYPDDQPIQGSCCNAMDMAKYQHQVDGLKPYGNIAEIPADPYNIRAGLAKTLLGYERNIALSGTDKVTFDAAMQMTTDKGPCCCHCWRWNTTEGLDKRLVTVRHMGAAEVARITDLVNGCGGPMDSPASSSTRLTKP